MSYKEELREYLALAPVETENSVDYAIQHMQESALDAITETALKEIHRKQVDALWELLEYMSQFPDINLANVRGWVKDFENKE